MLGPVLRLFQSYLGAETIHRAGAQHVLNAEYFQRIDALNYTMFHDDGQHVEGLEDADVVLVGVSRTSKTPTSIYLANRGIKTGNVPLVPGVPLAPRGREADTAAGGRSFSPAPSASCRSARTGCSALRRTATTTNISTRRRWRRRWLFRAGSAPRTTGRRST